MEFFKDVGRFFSYLTFVDIFFFIAIITLLILVVTLIYFIKINQDVLEDNKDDSNNNGNNGGSGKVNGLEKDILNIIDNSNNTPSNLEPPKVENDEYNDEEGELIDLAGLTKKLEMVRNTKEDSVTAYEKDQEEKAIISYDELLKKKNKYAINYEKEEVMDDLVVKKVDLHDLVNKNEIDEIKDVRVISYDREEAFLKALKELNQLLN